MHGKSREVHTKLSTRKPEEKETLGITDNVQKILKKWDRCRSCCKHHNAFPLTIKCETYIDNVRDC